MSRGQKQRAAGLGFEPRQTDPESVVLPLDDPAMGLYFIIILTLKETVRSIKLNNGDKDSNFQLQSGINS